MTTVETTPRDRGQGGSEEPQSGRPRVRAGGRLRAWVTGSGPEADPLAESASVTGSDWWARQKARAAGAAQASPYTARPESVAQTVAYVRAGQFVPGDHPVWVELPGYLYGGLVAVPLTVAGNALVWMAQRPSRLALVMFVLGLVWLSW